MKELLHTAYALGLRDESSASMDDSATEQTASDDQTDSETSGADSTAGGKSTASAGGEGEPDSPDGREPLPKDISFDILKNRRRRLVLKYVLEHENPVKIGTLAEHVAAIENGKDESELSSRERKRAYVGLYQAHLPRMHDAGVIEFNQNRGFVSLGPHAEDVLPYLTDTTEQNNFAWLYAALSTIGAGAFLISQSAFLNASTLGTIVVALVLTGLMAAAFWQVYAVRQDE